jgi:quinol monooxygenase YgiN
VVRLRRYGAATQYSHRQRHPVSSAIRFTARPIYIEADTSSGEYSLIPEVLRYRIGADRAAAFVEAYRSAGEWLSKSPHCRGYELMQSKKDPELFLLIIRWDSAEGHLQGFRRSEQFREFFAHIKPYIGDILEMEHYELTGVFA